jgi:hypothetical protein
VSSIVIDDPLVASILRFVCERSEDVIARRVALQKASQLADIYWRSYPGDENILTVIDRGSVSIDREASSLSLEIT